MPSENPWPPRTEEELRLAAEGGLLAEAHYCDVKRGLPPPGTPSNVAIATDMASMAVDGGVLFYGVDEATSPWSLAPIEMAGVKERLDQVSKALIDEPLHVRIEEIPSESNPGRGYVLVIIPPSPTRPHMVKGRYRGRGDTTNRVLADAEVVRLHQDRARWEADALELIEGFVASDPVRSGAQAHLFILGRPVTADAELVLRAIGSDSWEKWLIEKITDGPAAVSFENGWSPDISTMGARSRRAGGWAAHSARILADGSVDAATRENELIQLEVSEGGELRLYCGRGSDSLQDGTRVAIDALIAGLVKRMVLTASVISTECDYLGSWDFAVAMSNLRGAVSYDAHQSWGVRQSTYSEGDYRQATRATFEEIAGDTDGVVLRLVGRLRRALGDDARPLPQRLGSV